LVPLGDGIFCSKAAFNELEKAENSHDWACTLLKGVYGEKAAFMIMRVIKKYSENEKFSANFIMVAKCK